MKTLDRLQKDWLLSSEISKLEARIWRIARRDGIQTILFTSAVRGEGKSTTVAFVATYLGMYPDRRVLAMDFDFRIPKLNAYFGIKSYQGFDRVLKGDVGVADAIIQTELDGLHLTLPTEGGADPSLLLRTRVVLDAVTKLRESYDLVLIDSPALLPVADTTMLMPLADGVILTAIAGKTTEPQLRRAREICEGIDANILGIVVGNVEEAAPEYVIDKYDYYGNAGSVESSSAKPLPARRTTGGGKGKTR